MAPSFQLFSLNGWFCAYSSWGSNPCHHFPLPSALVKLPSYGIPAYWPFLSERCADSYQRHACEACTLTPNGSPLFFAAFAQPPMISFLGPMLVAFQCFWYLLSYISKLSWWLAMAIKYFAPALLYKLTSS